jgi:predicted lipoprotein with Yx(FWY)xxD motif
MVTRLVRRAVPLALLAALGAGAALAATTGTGGTVKAAQNVKLGKILVSSSGMTLYRMTAEKRGSIKCTGACAEFWPPLLVTGRAKLHAGPGITASRLGTIKRPDGRVQVTYAGWALYRYALDKKAGDAKGQGVQGVWFALTPAGALAKPAATSTPTYTNATTTSPGYGGADGY